MDILSKIVDRKMQEVADAAARVPENRLREQAGAVTKRRPFFGTLTDPDPNRISIIAEIKRASPSKGLIREDLDAATQAPAYEKGGAAALSVLTDRDFFQGSPDDLIAARNAVSLPVLRKDFLISSYHLYESAVMGADAVLLITRILSDGQLKDFIQLAGELGLAALVEVHSEEEVDRAATAGAELVGINNRNLKSFDTNLDTSIRMIGRLGPGQTAVAESGIGSPEDIVRLKQAGFNNFLIGESLVRASDPVAFLKSLMRRD